MTVVGVEGEMDVDTNARLETALADVLGHASVVLDLGSVTFIDSVGMRALFRFALAGARQGTSVGIAGARPSVERILRVTGVDGLVPIYPDVVSACAATT